MLAATLALGKTWSFNKMAGAYKAKRKGIGGGTPATLQCPKLPCLSDLAHLSFPSLSIPVKLPNGNEVDLGQASLLSNAAGGGCLPRPPPAPSSKARQGHQALR